MKNAAEFGHSVSTARTGVVDGKVEHGNLGSNVALSKDGTTLAVAIKNTGVNRGGPVHVFRFDKDEDKYVPLGGAIDISHSDDGNGYGLWLSYDGTASALGAPYYVNLKVSEKEKYESTFGMRPRLIAVDGNEPSRFFLARQLKYFRRFLLSPTVVTC